jgi:hypothetical protein
MNAAAIFGLVGVLLGAVVTVGGTVYREQLVSRRERDARSHQIAQDERMQRTVFQRESILSLQDAIADVVKSVFNEQDRMLESVNAGNEWPARRWDTPTATGWVEADLRLLSYRSRVFDERLRSMAGEIHRTAHASIWGPTNRSSNGVERQA